MLKFYKRVTYLGQTELLHRVIAAKALGRPLKQGEIVHHIDEDIFNNEPANLMVLKSLADHAALHMGAEAKYCWEGDHYICDKYQQERCEKCDTPIGRGTKTRQCPKCYIRHLSTSAPNPQVLEAILFENRGNFTQVAKQFGVSDNAVRKWCLKFGLSKSSSYYKWRDAGVVERNGLQIR